MTYTSAINRVLIKPDPEHQDITLSGGNKLLLDTTYEEEKHAVKSGVVIAVPEHLHYDTTRGSMVGSLEYDTDMELQVGDRVFFHHLFIYNCVENNEVIKDGDDFIVSGPYDMIYCAERDDEIIMINGWILVEPITETTESPLILPDTVASKRSVKTGKVAYVGNPLRQYRDFPSFVDDEVELLVGMEVVFTPYSDRPLEYALHCTVGEGKEYFRMQRIDVVGEVVE